MSDNQINIFAKVTDGKLKIENRHFIDEWTRRQNEGDDIVIRFTNSKDYRSLRQIRLFYKCLRTISEVTGHTISELKLILKEEAGLFYKERINNKDYTIIKSIGDMSSKELSDFIQFVDLWSVQTLDTPLLQHNDIKFLKDE